MSTGSPTAFRGANYPPNGLSHEHHYNMPNASPSMMHPQHPHSAVGGAASRPSPPMGSSLSPGMMASGDPPSPLAAGNGGPHSNFVPSRSFDRPPNTVVSNQYYIPQGEDVRPVPLGGEPSLGMQPTYRTDQVRTFEAKMFYGKDAMRDRGHGHGHGHRDTSIPGRHCSRCMHGYDDSQSTGAYTSASRSISTSSSSRSVERHRPRCRECRKEQRRGHRREVSKGGHRRHSSGRSGGQRLSTRPSSGPDYSRDRHHQRTYRGPSSDDLSSGRHRSGRPTGGRRRTHSSGTHTGSRGRSWSSRRDSSLVVVVGRKITSTNLHQLKDPLRRKVAAQLSQTRPGHKSRHDNPHRSSRRNPHHGVISKPRGKHGKHGRRHRGDHSAPPAHGHKVKRRSGSISSSSSSSSRSNSSSSSRKSSDSLCPYHAALRKKQMRKNNKRPKKSRHHKSSPNMVKQREAHSSVEDIASSSEDDGAQYFEPQTTHHYFHHYPELPSRKPNPFPLSTGTPLKRQGEEQGPGVAAVHHYPMSEKNAAKLKSGFPANPATAKAPYDRLKISTFEFEQPQDPEYPVKG